jgi:hypothetical protein
VYSGLTATLAPPDRKNTEVSQVRSIIMVPGVNLSHQEVVLFPSQNASVLVEQEAGAAVLPRKSQAW